MTEEIAALHFYVKSGVSLDHPAIRGFYEKWQKDSLVMLKWFSSLSGHSPQAVVISRLEQLEQDRLFQKDVPNYLRALYSQFARNNLVGFHALDGSGYRFMAEKIKWIDSFNPQVASRAASAFSLIAKVDPVRQQLMKASLNRIMEGTISRDTYEVVSKYLAQ